MKGKIMILGKEFLKKYAEFKKKAGVFDSIIKDQVYLTKLSNSRLISPAKAGHPVSVNIIKIRAQQVMLFQTFPFRTVHCPISPDTLMATSPLFLEWFFLPTLHCILYYVTSAAERLRCWKVILQLTYQRRPASGKIVMI